jgi:hypothetical protein
MVRVARVVEQVMAADAVEMEDVGAEGRARRMVKQRRCEQRMLERKR